MSAPEPGPTRAPSYPADAACATTDTPEWWFPADAGIDHRARAICLACPVRRGCLDAALERREMHGMWGGLSQKALRRLVLALPKLPAPIRHGTAAGARAHYRRGEKPCPPCAAAGLLDRHLRGDNRTSTAA